MPLKQSTRTNICEIKLKLQKVSEKVLSESNFGGNEFAPKLMANDSIEVPEDECDQEGELKAEQRSKVVKVILKGECSVQCVLADERVNVSDDVFLVVGELSENQENLGVHQVRFHELPGSESRYELGIISKEESYLLDKIQWIFSNLKNSIFSS